MAAGLILLVLLLAVHQLNGPGIWNGHPLPPGKVKPQLVNDRLCAILLAPDGSLWAWGGTPQWNFPVSSRPQDVTFSEVPRRIGSDSNWRQVAFCQDLTLALKDDGSLWAWHFNQLYGAPTRIGTETNWSQLCAADGNNLALKNDGSLWTWPSDSSAPAMVGTDRDWRTIAVVGAASLALKSYGTLWGWGRFDGSNYRVPRPIAAGTNWLAISANGSFILALKTDGTLWTSGSNVSRVPSLPFTGLSTNFIQLGPDKDWAEIFAGEDCSFFALKKDGSWWGCGQNLFGQLGLGTNITAVASPQRLPFELNPWAFAPGVQATLCLGKDGKLWTWGKRLGLGQPSAKRLRFEAFVAPAVNRFPTLGFLIKSDIDYAPHLLWELPPEVRRALGTGSKDSTNISTTAHPAGASHE